MHPRAGVAGAVGGEARQVLRQRVREAHVRNDAVAEKGADTAAGPVDELIGKHEIGGGVFLLQAADRAGRQNPFDAEHLHAEDVGAVIELARVQPVAGAVTGQEGHALAAQRRQDVGPRRIAEWRLQDLLFAIRQLGHVVEAAAADDANLDSQLCTLNFALCNQITLSTKRLPSFSRNKPAAIDGSCSKKSKYSFSIASRAKVRLKPSVSIGYRS